MTGYVSKTFPSLRLEAEDVALEAIYAALRNIGNFDPSKGALFSWVNRQARWHAMTRIRTQAKSLGATRGAVAAPLDGRVQSAEEARHLLAQLTPEELRLLTLKFVEHRSYRQIAKLWGASHTTVVTKLDALMTKLSE